MLDLALVFLKIGLASFGGGWTIVGIIRSEILQKGWLTSSEFSELVAIAQSTPGPVALNAATMTGYKLYGILGGIVATLSVVAVPVILAVVLCLASSKLKAKNNKRLTEALKTGTIGLIIMTAWSFSSQAIGSIPSIVISIIAFIVVSFTKISPVIIIFAAGLAGILFKGI